MGGCPRRSPIPAAIEVIGCGHALRWAWAGTHTQAEAARELGLPRSAVSKVLSRKSVNTKKDNMPKPPLVRLTLDPTRDGYSLIESSDAQAVSPSSQIMVESSIWPSERMAFKSEALYGPTTCSPT